MHNIGMWTDGCTHGKPIAILHVAQLFYVGLPTTDFSILGDQWRKAQKTAARGLKSQRQGEVLGEGH